jgi:hypothetical protein
VPRPRLLLPLVLFLLGAAAPAHAATVVRSEAGADAASIQDTVDLYRADLGANNGVTPPAASGRREITWAGVPAAQADPNPFPGGYHTARGVLLSTPGTSLRVSNDGFSSYGTTFTPFSPPSLFSPFGSTITVVDFQVPGSSTPALTRGFGAVFANSTSHSRIQLLDAGGDVIRSQAAPVGEVAFVGVSFDTPRVSQVRITSGDHTPDSSATDETALDNFIFGEPQADQDRDGVPSTTDNCPDVANAGQDDLDSDDIGDACDEDVDGDGVPNTRDAFPLDKRESSDSDGDGIGDKADTDDDNDGVPDKDEGKRGTNQRSADTDGDGVDDGLDNCPINPNPDQADSDGDKRGDACEDMVPPRLSKLSLRPRTFRRGTKNGTRVSFRLSEPATVQLTVLKAVRGHYKAVHGSIIRKATAGVNLVRFEGRIGGHSLRGGRHILLATATDLAGFPAKGTARAKFRILP